MADVKFDLADVKFDFKSNVVQILKAMDTALGKALQEASAEIVAQTANLTPVDTGRLKGSWQAVVDEKKGIATIGSDVEYSIYIEFGTGIYASDGSGRKTPWFYKDKNGKSHVTKGVRPRHMFQRGWELTQPKIENHFSKQFGMVFK